MWPSRLLNAACVIIASALTCFGAWTESWPATETSWTMTTNGNATARNKDLWYAWKERMKASGQFPGADLSGDVVYWITNSVTNVTVVYTNSGTVYTNSFTNRYPVYVTNSYSATNDTWPTNMGKYRIILPWPEPQTTDGGEWVEPWSGADMSAYAYTSGVLPDMSFALWGTNYPPMVISNVVRRRQTGASTNTPERDYYTWLVPEFDTNGPVKVNAPVIYSGRKLATWGDVFKGSDGGALSTNPYASFWSGGTGALSGTFEITGQYLQPTNYVWTNATQSGIAASSNPVMLAYPFARVTAVSESGAGSNTTLTVYHGTNATRTRVPLLANDVQRTTFNAEYYRAGLYQNVKFEAHGWVPAGGEIQSTYQGTAVNEFDPVTDNASNGLVVARAGIPATVLDAFAAATNTTTSYNTNTYYETYSEEAGTNRNYFDGDAGTLATVGGSVQTETDAIVVQTPIYNLTTSTVAWVSGEVMGVAVSNSYLMAAEDVLIGDSGPPFFFPEYTNGVQVGTNFHPWAGGRVTVTAPGADIVPRAFKSGNAYTGYWYSVRSVPHTCDFFWAVEGNTNLSIVSPMQLRESVGESSAQWVKGTTPISDWYPVESDMATNAAETRSWSVPTIWGVYRYGSGYTRP